jgi:hypothetical protein
MYGTCSVAVQRCCTYCIYTPIGALCLSHIKDVGFNLVWEYLYVIVVVPCWYAPCEGVLFMCRLLWRCVFLIKCCFSRLVSRLALLYFKFHFISLLLDPVFVALYTGCVLCANYWWWTAWFYSCSWFWCLHLSGGVFCDGAVGKLCDLTRRGGFLLPGSFVGLGGVGVYFVISYFVMLFGILAGHRKFY